MTNNNNPETNDTEKGNLQAGKTKEQPLFSRGSLIAIVGIAVVIVILLIAGFAQNPAGTGTVVPSQACAEKTLQFVNDNLAAPGTSASLYSVSETHGMYEMRINYEGQAMFIYTARDCSSLFTSRIDMNATEGRAGTAQSYAAPVKTDCPVVDLYVMAFCPWGTLAENAMKPTAALIGSKADIRVRYITSGIGTTVASVRSLHGTPEAEEDLCQLCILKKNPEKFWDYLGRFNDACYPQYQNADALGVCRRNVTTSVGIDSQAIETCANGEEGLSLLKVDKELADANGARASPTLIINGQEYRGSRTPDAYKQAICDHFVTQPGECSTTLPPLAGGSAVANGGCG